MKTLTDSLWWMTVLLTETLFLCFTLPFAISEMDWILVAFMSVGIIAGIIGQAIFADCAREAERDIRRRTDINITIDHKDDADRPVPANTEGM